MIDLQHLTVELGGRCILSDISFKLSQGDFLAILGPNGSGKSTLIRALLGVVPVKSGSISVGRDKSETAPGKGYVPQIKTMDRTFPAESVELVATSLINTWPWRVRGNLRLRAKEALRRAGAGHLARRPVSTLSGGELQRIYLARAILGDPELLLLDEPEAGVDSAGASTLFDVIDEVIASAGTTIVMVTHDWDVALHHASHVLLLNQRQIAFGTPDEALTEDAIRTAFGHVGHRHEITVGRTQK